MSTLLILTIAVLLLNYWLCVPVQDAQSHRPAPAVAFSIGALIVTAPLTWIVAQVLARPQLVPLRDIVSVLLLAIALPLALQLILSRIEMSEAAARMLRRRVLLNCSVFALALLHSTLMNDFGSTLLLGVAVGLGFELALYVFSEQQARVARAPVPEPFRGAPIALISAGLMALALMGLKGLF